MGKVPEKERLDFEAWADVHKKGCYVGRARDARCYGDQADYLMPLQEYWETWCSIIATVQPTARHNTAGMRAALAELVRLNAEQDAANGFAYTQDAAVWEEKKDRIRRCAYQMTIAWDAARVALVASALDDIDLAREIEVYDAKNKELRAQVRLLDEQAQGVCWRWQADGQDSLATMGASMSILIYASDLRALIAEAAQTPIDAHALANLRHAYSQMVSGGVDCRESAARMARGLIGPAIEKIERAQQPTHQSEENSNG